jgi:PHD/YefM family antitoxin component YafN of YafNO toxin-antitoxin module
MAGPIKLAELPRRNATQVKNQWGSVVRQVQEQGRVAITSHSNVEMVMVDANVYEQMVDALDAARRHDDATLAELAARFDARLGVLQAPAAEGKVDKLFKARGKLRGRRPKAGASY